MTKRRREVWKCSTEPYDATATKSAVAGGGAVEGDAMIVSFRHRLHILWLQLPHSGAPMVNSVLHSWHAPTVGTSVTAAGASTFEDSFFDLSPVFFGGYRTH